ncbi:MAG: CRISPR-associated endoribonuclease Cas6 [Oscillatoriales cyanobacterium RM2_1_1]|nr:CRISPR-associated endoribonuclease Cas6 [Oscillatoriales cyanobacterium SM2_3_0]NJO47343.1 CRISPR-associated endoribonuclease Cas6 [Oscillatoriales cyanobacterium RM2_1_1]
MPYSLVLNLLSGAPISKQHLSGRHLHALFLELVQSVDPNLSTILHQQTTDKAFTLSPLQVLSHSQLNRKNSSPAEPIQSNSSSLQFQQDRSISAGTPCWWRVSLLDEGLFGQLMHLWLNLNPNQPWHLGGAELCVTSILSNPQPHQPWAGFISYAQMFQDASDTERQLQLKFCTPTTFRLTKYDCALPSKELVFKSLLRRWNQYSEMPILEEVLEPIYPSFFEIRTEMVTDSRSKLIGCVGNVTFQILGEVEPLVIQQINTLADFAFYAGVGRKTPMGMGIVRRININKGLK